MFWPLDRPMGIKSECRRDSFRAFVSSHSAQTKPGSSGAAHPRRMAYSFLENLHRLREAFPFDEEDREIEGSIGQRDVVCERQAVRPYRLIALA